MSDNGNNSGKGGFDFNAYAEKIMAWAKEKPYHAIAAVVIILIVLYAIF